MIKISDYSLGFKIVSLALDEEAKRDLIEDELDFLYVEDENVTLFPEEIVLNMSCSDIKWLRNRSNYDVYEIWQDGQLIEYFDNATNDNYFFISGRCNSNCIMCPSSDYSRINGIDTAVDSLILMAKHIPSNVGHLTITGGEPFIIGEQIFEFIDFLKYKFTTTEFLLLTNGRIFAVEKYANMLNETIPEKSVIAIPLHASYADLHDSITQSIGSFKQTCVGIKRLLNLKLRIELRIVISKLNIEDINRLAEYICKEFPSISYVSVIAMEMTGNAYKNREKVWIPYTQIFPKISEAIHCFISNGINVRLYNFPLCTVPKVFWNLCEKSISPEKVRYDGECMKCTYKNACGGVFSGTINMERDELKAIL